MLKWEDFAPMAPEMDNAEQPSGDAGDAKTA
jgi:hypothetical protein